MFDLYFAGDSSGFPKSTPGIIWNGLGNVLLSYEHPARERAVSEIMKLYLAGLGLAKKFNILNESGYDRLFSYELNQQMIDTTIHNNRILRVVNNLIKETDMFKRNELKEELIKLCEDNPGTITEEEVEKLKEDLMDLYLVGPEKANIMAVATGELNHNMLFSYLDKYGIEKFKEDVSAHGKLFIDSGAFTAWTQGKTIDVDEYINWINNRSDYIDLYGQVDVIPGDRTTGKLPSQEEVKIAAQKTWENYLYMRPKMKKPEGLLYTFHVGEPIEFLKQALEWKDKNGNHIPYIALGGMVGKTAEIRDLFLEHCFDVIKKSSNPDVKTHAFGMTDRNLLTKYPITSADSTSWIMTGATGSIMTDVGIVCVSSQQSKDPNHFSHLPQNLRDEFNKTIGEFGFTLEELAESRDARIMHNARYMKKKFSEIEYKPQIKRKKLF